MKTLFRPIRVAIKPLSINVCWQGKRFKTAAYLRYQKELLYRLPALSLPKPPYRVEYEFGVSNMQADADNPVKPLQDILSKRYGFNDADIHELTTRKVKVAKGAEYISFHILPLAS